MDTNPTAADRHIVFISKGTPEDDDFVTWLAPRLEAQGYKVFADILSLDAGSRWRKEITDTLQNTAVKMLLCCNDVTLGKRGVQEEIGIAEDLSRELGDPNFIVPLRLEKFRKLFGIGELQYLNFEGRWADGLTELLDALDTAGVPRTSDKIEINANWENYRCRNAIAIEDAPERLTSNWLRVTSLPDSIRYFQPTGAVDHGAMQRHCRSGFQFPAEPYLRGFFSFCGVEEVNRGFDSIANFQEVANIPIWDFLDRGAEHPQIWSREASNLVVSLLRRAWETYARQMGLYEYYWSQSPGFHVSENQLPIGRRMKWGRQGENRSSMLINIAKGKVWQFGVTAIPSLWPYPHFRLKARVLFADVDGEKAGSVIDDKAVQHRSRRGICKGWRNKQWHGRLMAFLELLSGEQSTINLPVGATQMVKIDATPELFTSPVTTALPDVLLDEDEDLDGANFGPSFVDDEDEED